MSNQSQLSSTQNVTRLNNQSVYSHIQTFLRSKGLRSKNTQNEYRKDLEQFYSFMCNKSLEELTPSDLIFINADILYYQNYLSEEYKSTNGEGYKNVTVNRKLAAVSSLYQFLKRNDYNVNAEAMTVDPLPDDSTGYGFLTFEEAEALAELALTEREQGKQKRALIMLATRTSMRKNALLSLKWSDINQSPNEPGIFIISVSDKDRQDKGKRITKEISKKMFEILLELKGDRTDDDFIFTLNEKYVNMMMTRLIVKLGIDPRRNVTFHSLKKAGIGFVKDLTNDIEAASDQAGHSSINTTKKYYLEGKKNLAGIAMDEQIASDIFKQLTHDECIHLLESITNGLGHQLKRKAQEILNNRA